MNVEVVWAPLRHGNSRETTSELKLPPVVTLVWLAQHVPVTFWLILLGKRGVPDKLKQLMAATSKNEAERLASAMTVTLTELANLNWNADRIGFPHREKHTKSAPRHLVPSEQEIHAIFNNAKAGSTISPEAKKAISEIDSLIKERRHVSAHMFQNADGWHLFYDEDSFHLPWKRNHWEHGPHVHYTSHLFTLRVPDEIWVALDERKFKIPAVHIRFEYGRDD